MAPRIPTLLKKEHLLELFPFAQKIAREAGRCTTAPAIDCDPSFIPMAAGADVPDTSLLIIDVGGTHIRCAVRTTAASGISEWTLLDDILNNDLKGTASGNPLDRMFGALAPVVVTGLDRRKIKRKAVKGIGLIWSNKLASEPLDPSNGGITGVTGKISGLGAGTSYRKGEWFTEGLKDGDDAGGSCIEAFRHVGISPSAFIIGNDTIETGNAIIGADAGMVASTGANATIIPPGGSFFHNSEAGGNFEIPAGFLPGLYSPDCSCVKLEDGMAGVGLPGIFSQFIRITAAGIPALQKPAAMLSSLDEPAAWKHFRPEDLSALLNEDFAFFSRGKDPVFCTDEIFSLFGSLAAEVIDTGGRLAAVLAYISICNQLPERDHFIVALDSTMARTMKGYLVNMEETIDSVLRPQGKSCKIVLIEPIGKISPPMIGAARSVNHFL